MSTRNICHKGTINKMLDNILYVEIERHTACAACHAKNICLSFSKKEAIIPVATNEPEKFQVGEVVQLTMKQSMGSKAVVIAYLFPFLVLALGLLVTYYFTKNELLSIGVSFAATILYFLLIKKIDKRLQKQFSFVANKMEE